MKARPQDPDAHRAWVHDWLRASAAKAATSIASLSRDEFMAMRPAERGDYPQARDFLRLGGWGEARRGASESGEGPAEPSPIASPATIAPALQKAASLIRPPRFPTRCEKMLVIPDAHAHPQYDNERFTWLGRLIADERPDCILQLGDFADLPSLSHYDRGKRGFEGRRYTKDVAACRDALAKIDAPLKSSAATYVPTRVLLLGNHEDRVTRATYDQSELDGTISTDDLGFSEHGWRVVPYQETAVIAGFSCSHHFASGVAGRPIGGMNAAGTMARLLFTSAIVGHSHVMDTAERTRPDGSKVCTIVAGCYVHPEHSEGWSKASERLWWKGVLLLEGAENGYWDAMRWVTQARMQRLYGGA